MSDQSDPSISLTPSKRVDPLTYISRMIAFLSMDRLNWAISTFASDISAFSKFDPSTVASKKTAPNQIRVRKITIPHNTLLECHALQILVTKITPIEVHTPCYRNRPSRLECGGTTGSDLGICSSRRSELRGGGGVGCERVDGDSGG